MIDPLAIPSRSRQRELMDDHVVEGEDLRRVLDELERINRRLGGIGSSLWLLEKIHKRSSRWGPTGTVSILDVGTGGGDFPRAFVRALDRRAKRVTVVGLDLNPASCIEASGRKRSFGWPRYVAGDAFVLPFRDRGFDLVHCSLFLHHFGEGDIARLLAEMLRVSRLGVMINDLHRHRLAVAGIRLLARLFSQSRFIRNDAPLSVRRGFLRHEIVSIWRDGGLPSPEIFWRWAFRYMVWTPRNDGHGIG